MGVREAEETLGNLAQAICEYRSAMGVGCIGAWVQESRVDGVV